LEAPVLLTPLEVGLCLLVLLWHRRLQWSRWMLARRWRRCWSPMPLDGGCSARSISR